MNDPPKDPVWHFARGAEQQGPIPEARLREMLATGELAAHELVWRAGMAQWTPAAHVPGLLPAPLPVIGGPPPVPIPTASVAYYAPVPGQPQPEPFDAGMRMLLPVGRSGWAIAAGYLGLLSLAGGCLGPVAVIVSLIAMRDLRKHPERRGMGRVITGLSLGGLGTLALLMMVVQRTGLFRF